jgi:signal transduction histidine kinase
VEDKVRAFEVGGVDYVTKPFQVQEVLARVESQLRLQWQRNRIEALNVFKDELLGMVSHDLKNPIHVIRGYVSLIQYDIEEGKPFNPALLGRIQSSTDKMVELVTDLLDRARDESRLPLRLALHPLNALVETEVGLFDLQAKEKSIVLTFEPNTSATSDVKVNVDRGRFQQVIGNLISNAIKYTNHGGQVTVRTHAENGKVLIQVADTGYGIPESDLPHIFEKFYRVQRDQHLAEEGTGLGLPIARLIIEEHRGSLIAESELGQGSAFTITLPQA